MNRHQRRAAEKRPAPAPAGSRQPAAGAAPAKPGWLLRLIALVLLSGWMLRRVRHPQVLAMLRGLAREANREDAYRQLSERLRLPL